MIHGLILLRGSKRLRRVHSGSRQDVKVQQAATLGGLLANVSKLNNVVAPPPFLKCWFSGNVNWTSFQTFPSTTSFTTTSLHTHKTLFDFGFLCISARSSSSQRSWGLRVLLKGTGTVAAKCYVLFPSHVSQFIRGWEQSTFCAEIHI